MTTLYDAGVKAVIPELTKELKSIKELTPPEWSKFVKTGTSKERAPTQENWWYIRTASILCNVYKFGPVGVERLRTKYGGRKNMGCKKEKFKKGSGKIIRTILAQLESAKLVEKTKKGKVGRKVTSAGQKLVDAVSFKVSPKK